MLTHADIIALLSQDGSREDMLQRAWRMGMESAVAICEARASCLLDECIQAANAKADDELQARYDGMRCGAEDCADAIRAEADATSAKPPRR